MPTYDYYCSACDRSFEVFHAINEKPNPLCDVCSGKTEKMVGGGSGIIYKGSGFYTTDYNRSSAYKDSVKKESQ